MVVNSWWLLINMGPGPWEILVNGHELKFLVVINSEKTRRLLPNSWKKFIIRKLLLIFSQPVGFLISRKQEPHFYKGDSSPLE